MNIIVDALEKHGELSCDLVSRYDDSVDAPAYSGPSVKSVGGVVHPDDLCAHDHSNGHHLNQSRSILERLSFRSRGAWRDQRRHALVINASQAAGAFEIDVNE